MSGQKTSTEPEPDLPCEVGYAWVFEKTAIYGSAQDMISMLRSRNAKNRHGQFVGVVKTVIPVDPYCVLFEYFKSTAAFLKRQKERRFKRRMGITRLQMRDQRKLSKWCRK